MYEGIGSKGAPQGNAAGVEHLLVMDIQLLLYKERGWPLYNIILAIQKKNDRPEGRSFLINIQSCLTGQP